MHVHIYIYTYTHVCTNGGGEGREREREGGEAFDIPFVGDRTTSHMARLPEVRLWVLRPGWVRIRGNVERRLEGIVPSEICGQSGKTWKHKRRHKHQCLSPEHLIMPCTIGLQSGMCLLSRTRLSQVQCALARGLHLEDDLQIYIGASIS